MAALTETALKLLLVRLDSEDARQAAEKYQELRMKLIRLFVWRGGSATDADLLADETIDRVALKLESGVEIQSLHAYAAQVSRFVWFEHFRRPRETGLDETDASKIPVSPEVFEKSNLRLECMQKCLQEIVPNASDRTLLLNYYDSDDAEKNKVRRKSLAERLGLSINTLKVRVCRLREKVEICTRACLTNS